MGRRTPSRWTTDLEVAFLEGLGRDKKSASFRLELLRNYLKAIPLRADWGAVRSMEIQVAAKAMLAEEEGRHEKPKAEGGDSATSGRGQKASPAEGDPGGDLRVDPQDG